MKSLVPPSIGVLREQRGTFRANEKSFQLRWLGGSRKRQRKLEKDYRKGKRLRVPCLLAERFWEPWLITKWRKRSFQGAGPSPPPPHCLWPVLKSWGSKTPLGSFLTFCLYRAENELYTWGGQGLTTSPHFFEMTFHTPHPHL